MLFEYRCLGGSAGPSPANSCSDSIRLHPGPPGPSAHDSTPHTVVLSLPSHPTHPTHTHGTCSNTETASVPKPRFSVSSVAGAEVRHLKGFFDCFVVGPHPEVLRYYSGQY